LAQKPAPSTYSGSFIVYVRGFWSGSGVATVTAGTVQIQATVTDDSGQTGPLIADNLPLVDNHFRGTGTVFGIPMTVEGRVEAADPVGPGKGKGKGKAKGRKPNDDAVLTNARIGATFLAGAHGGRIAGSRGP
jgi:hypothetical protein